MELMAGLKSSFSGLEAQRIRMNVTAANLANATVTRTPEGGPYKRQDVVFAAQPATSFDALLSNELGQGIGEVYVQDIARDTSGGRLEYDPTHPDANAEGYVAYPNVNVLEEMVNLMAAGRAYEANITAINAAKDMAQRALQIGRV